MNQHLLIVGCGDIGRRVGQLAQNDGWRVSGLVRSEQSAAQLENLGLRPIVANLLDGEGLAELPVDNSVILYAAPPPGGGFSDPKILNFCRSLSAEKKPARIIYLSTSGVYGDCGDQRVTEETPANPQTARARRRLDAETTLRNCGRDLGITTIILRVTGIYGPFRFALHRILEQHPLLREDQASFTNRIHADDLAKVCLEAIEKGEDGDIFNVCDGQESTMTHYFNAVADAFGLARPPLIDKEEALQVMNPLMLSYFQESRRMDNRKLLDKLAIELRFPTLEEGLKASVAEMRRIEPEFFERLKKQD